MSWRTYQLFFADVSRYLKLSIFCKELDIKPSNLSNFIKYGTHSLTIDKLKLLYDHILDYCSKIG